ncbi:BMP family protein [Naasia sp. SYSU D00948]|uniref:BMP family lipoprotein n=1 Tax=Naasia sp. SYSU D00948 TaxID=2817379 RepID=UPI001B302E2F|nr:BMP family ABC transporter substrate-binding protein [Naasia sp. SYSU D00948]
MTTIPRRGFAAIASLGAAALLLAGCAPAPEEGGATSGGGDAAGTDVVPCMVSDTGGFDDKSFNQLGSEGLEEGAEQIGVEARKVQSDTDADYQPNIDGLINEGCTLIFTVGFALSQATVEAATANPDIDFAIIDDAADNDFDGETDAENIKPILFDTAQAAFLAGYAAAATSKTGIVGTYGGMNFPTVSIFMDGFAQGVEYYNSEKGATVQVLGWDRAAQDGTFIGGFEAGTDSLNAAQNLIDQGADVLLPVGGPIYQSAAQAIRDSGKDIALIGCDADLFETDPQYADIYLTSILKGMKVATTDVIVEAAESGFDTTPYLGTLENEGVGIAPFHEYEDKVPAELQGEIDAIREQIVSGELAVESYLAA